MYIYIYIYIYILYIEREAENLDVGERFKRLRASKAKHFPTSVRRGSFQRK